MQAVPPARLHVRKWSEPHTSNFSKRASVLACREFPWTTASHGTVSLSQFGRGVMSHSLLPTYPEAASAAIAESVASRRSIPHVFGYSCVSPLRDRPCPKPLGEHKPRFGPRVPVCCANRRPLIAPRLTRHRTFQRVNLRLRILNHNYPPRIQRSGEGIFILRNAVDVLSTKSYQVH